MQLHQFKEYTEGMDEHTEIVFSFPFTLQMHEQPYTTVMDVPAVGIAKHPINNEVRLVMAGKGINKCDLGESVIDLPAYLTSSMAVDEIAPLIKQLITLMCQTGDTAEDRMHLAEKIESTVQQVRFRTSEPEVKQEYDRLKNSYDEMQIRLQQVVQEKDDIAASLGNKIYKLYNGADKGELLSEGTVYAEIKEMKSKEFAGACIYLYDVTPDGKHINETLID